ncbi:MAG: T9SS type A sorting domain-containing protein [Chitinophagales bacterium]|nr:T9SS type A sorting domain-containing protein [Chitinophagales bacterium]
MKSLLSAFMLLATVKGFSQPRYLNEVFTDVTVTSGVEYAQNYSVLTGTPVLQSLVTDIYEPAGDTLSQRPLVLYFHASDFLPLMLNGSPVGDMHDSCAAEICRRLARRGFVAASVDYRIGWNPISADQDIRTGTLLQAVYRGVQDARSCIRYFRMNASAQGNTYRIDPDCITVGGEGSSGYISTACASLNHYSELTLLKFISSTNGQPYIDTTVFGNLEGFGGAAGMNNDNWPGYPSNVSMVFNLEGAIGDSTWIEPGEAPMVSFHDVNNPGAPYTNGPVIGPAGYVVWVTGSHDMIRIANQLGNNNVFNVSWNDPFTDRADEVNEGWEGLFPIAQPDPSIIIPGNPYNGQWHPWQWWDSLDLQTVAPYYGIGSAQATAAYLSGFLTNPDMSKQKAMRYIDTVMGYLVPRIVQNCALPGFISGIAAENEPADDIRIYPVPALDNFFIKAFGTIHEVQAVSLFDPSGRLVREITTTHQSQVQINRSNLPAGMYLVKIKTDRGSVYRKVLMQ